MNPIVGTVLTCLGVIAFFALAIWIAWVVEGAQEKSDARGVAE